MRKKYRRYYEIANITIQVESDLPISEKTFHPKFKHFEAAGPGKDTIIIRHHFSLPDLNSRNLGKEFYRRPPWAVYKKGDSWIYLGISSIPGDKSLHRVAFFNSDHSLVRIYNDGEEAILKGNANALTLFSTDQLLLAPALAYREGFFLHSCGVNFEGKGLLFAGHSGAGKSTMATMLKGKAEILCDDRIIVRKKENKFKIYGTWSHGDIPDVSANSVPLRAILFLNQSKKNYLTLLKDKKIIARKLLNCLIRPFATFDWWQKSLTVLDNLCDATPCYELYFDKSGKIVNLLEDL